MRKVRGDQGLALKALLCEIDDQAAKVEANSALSKTAKEIRHVVVKIRSLLDKALLGQEEDSLLGCVCAVFGRDGNIVLCLAIDEHRGVGGR